MNPFDLFEDEDDEPRENPVLSASPAQVIGALALGGLVLYMFTRPSTSAPSQQPAVIGPNGLPVTSAPGPAPLPDILPPSYYRLTATNNSRITTTSHTEAIASAIRSALPNALSGLTGVEWDGNPVFTYGNVQWDLTANTNITVILMVSQSATDAQRLALANNIAQRLRGVLESIRAGWSNVSVQLVHKG